MRRTTMILTASLILAGCETIGSDMMATSCRNEAAKQFDQRPENLWIFPREQSADGYSIFGQWPVEEIAQGIFERGALRSVTRT
jgi:hypothetical protein